MSAKQPSEAIIAAHGPVVLRVCRAVLGPAGAADAWSETFLAALRAYPDNGSREAGTEGVRAPRELRHTGISVRSESGAANAVITRVTRHFSSRTTKTTYPRELRPVITAGVGVMDRISFSRLLLYAVDNHIGTLGHGRFRRKLAVFGPVTLSIELGCVYPH